MHIIHLMTHEIQIYFRSCMANSKRKFKLLCAKLSSNSKYIKVTNGYLFVFMVLFCSSFGSWSKRPCALQLSIKMLIRRCLMWEGLLFYTGTSSLRQGSNSFKYQIKIQGLFQGQSLLFQGLKTIEVGSAIFS